MKGDALTECNSFAQQGIDIFGARPMINDGCPQGELTIDCSHRRRGNARFLQSDRKLRIHLIGIGATITKAHNI
jgi:hypothetical protein